MTSDTSCTASLVGDRVGRPSVGRYIRTAARLHPTQVKHQLLNRLPIQRPITFENLPTPCDPPVSLVSTIRSHPSYLGDGRFVFLNVEGDLRREGWQGCQHSHLWRYNQHYFAYLNQEAIDPNEARSLVEDWIASNPAGTLPGWEPYPTSLRIWNWIRCGHIECERGPISRSLAAQSRWLAANMELHLLGNHLIANCKALLCAGLWFEGAEAQRWAASATNILIREVGSQILPDGGHFELSPMYHAIVLEDLLDILNLLGGVKGSRQTGEMAVLDETIRTVIVPMFVWLKNMTHDADGIAHFGDSVGGVAPSIAKLFDYARRLGLSAHDEGQNQELWIAPDSGYVKLSGRRYRSIIKLEGRGPRYLPGHSHADSLSLEMSVDGHRLITNPGVSLYEEGRERLRQRGTAAHSTLAYSYRDSSEVWGSFRMGRSARVSWSARTIGGRSVISAEHDGFSLRRSRVVHRRTMVDHGDALHVRDDLEGGASGNPVTVRYYIAPGWTCDRIADAEFLLSRPVSTGDLAVKVSIEGRDIDTRLERYRFHRSFGDGEDATCLSIVSGNASAAEIETRLGVER